MLDLMMWTTLTPEARQQLATTYLAQTAQVQPLTQEPEDFDKARTNADFHPLQVTDGSTGSVVMTCWIQNGKTYIEQSYTVDALGRLSGEQLHSGTVPRRPSNVDPDWGDGLP